MAMRSSGALVLLGPVEHDWLLRSEAAPTAAATPAAALRSAIASRSCAGTFRSTITAARRTTGSSAASTAEHTTRQSDRIIVRHLQVPGHSPRLGDPRDPLPRDHAALDHQHRRITDLL